MHEPFGDDVTSAGTQLITAARTVHAEPAKYSDLPFVQMPQSDSVDYLECLAYAIGYWLHIFITSDRKTDGDSIISLSFTHLPDATTDPNAGYLLDPSLFQASEG